MTISNIKYYYDLPFEDYLKLPGTSFSMLKGGDITETAAMQLGTRVHNFLNEPTKYDWQQAEIVRPIAAAIIGYIGNAFHYLHKEVAFTCDMIHNGLVLQYRGRADMICIGKIVVDLKIIAGSIQASCDRFGHIDQVSGYCLGTTTPVGLIIAYNKSRKAVETKVIKPVPGFWEYQVVRLGRVAA